MAKNRRSLDNKYRYGDSPAVVVDNIHKTSSETPLTVKAYDKSDGEYFSTHYHITLHYVNRYIQRVYGVNPYDYQSEAKHRLAQMLASILPVGTGLSTDYIDDQGVKSLIREGIAITIYLTKRGKENIAKKQG